MTAHWIKPAPDQTGPAPTRGAAAVGRLHELPVLELTSILLLRRWCDGEAGRTRIAMDFALALAPARTAETVNHLGHLITLLVQHGRRPMMRHDMTCDCFGGDEAVFAQLIAAATAGDRDDAMAFALTLLPPNLAYEAVQCAEPLGLAILTFARALHIGAQPQPTCH